MSINQDVKNIAVGLIAGGGLAYGMAEKPENEKKAINLIIFGIMIWLIVILILKE